MDLYLGDCLEIMPILEDNSIDFILTDIPYGITGCKWDTVIPFEPMWKQIWRVLKPNGACALFGSEPFSSALRMSQIKYFKYDWIWQKNRPANINCAKIRPLKYHEIISIFSVKKENYFPQKIDRSESGKCRVEIGHKKNHYVHYTFGELNRGKKGKHILDTYHKYDCNNKNPSTILKFNRENRTIHTTQKPVALLEYLIKTYTNEGETVLDFTMGSGSTGVACANTGRYFIGIEKEQKYFDLAKERLDLITFVLLE